MDFATMKKRVAMAAQDPLMRQLDDAQYGEMINLAVQDLGAAGWLLPIVEDESIVFVANTYEYNVPADFAYIRSLRYEDDTVTPSTYDYEIPKMHWRLAYIAADTPAIVFDSRLYTFTAGDHLKVVGQKRPTEYTSDSDTIEAGMESFIRERAIAYTARTLAMMPVEGHVAQAQATEGDTPSSGARLASILPGAEERRAARLMALSERCLANSERMLAYHPQEVRCKPGSRRGPTR